jgi:hypothetical protein
MFSHRALRLATLWRNEDSWKSIQSWGALNDPDNQTRWKHDSYFSKSLKWETLAVKAYGVRWHTGHAGHEETEAMGGCSTIDSDKGLVRFLKCAFERSGNEDDDDNEDLDPGFVYSKVMKDFIVKTDEAKQWNSMATVRRKQNEKPRLAPEEGDLNQRDDEWTEPIWESISSSKTMVEIRGDSSPIINWVNGKYDIKADYLRVLVVESMEAMKRGYDDDLIVPITVADPWFRHIFREHNGDADTQANLAEEISQPIEIEMFPPAARKWQALMAKFDGSRKTSRKGGTGVCVYGSDVVLGKVEWELLGLIRIRLMGRTISFAEALGAWTSTALIIEMVKGKPIDEAAFKEKIMDKMN